MSVEICHIAEKLQNKVFVRHSGARKFLIQLKNWSLGIIYLWMKSLLEVQAWPRRKWWKKKLQDVHDNSVDLWIYGGDLSPWRDGWSQSPHNSMLSFFMPWKLSCCALCPTVMLWFFSCSYKHKNCYSSSCSIRLFSNLYHKNPFLDIRLLWHSLYQRRTVVGCNVLCYASPCR